MTRASAAKLEAEVAAATAATVGAVPEVEDGCDKSTTSTSSIANTSASARMVAMAGALDVAVEVPRCPTSYMNDERKACFPVGLELSSSSSSSSVSSSPPPSVPTLPEDGLGSCEELDGPKPASSSSSQSSFMSSGMLQWPVKAEESHTLATSADEGSVGSDNTLRGGDGGSARAYAASISAASSSLSSLSPSSFAHGVSLSTDHGIAGPSSDTVSSSDSSDKPLRKGKWTAEEEAYTSAIIEDFSKGFLLLAPGTTLRSFLSEKLHCDPMRITKKFAGNNCIGKQVFQPCERVPLVIEEMAKAKSRLSVLEKAFKSRIAVQQKKTRSKNSVGGASLHLSSNPTRRGNPDRGPGSGSVRVGMMSLKDNRPRFSGHQWLPHHAAQQPQHFAHDEHREASPPLESPYLPDRAREAMEGKPRHDRIVSHEGRANMFVTTSSDSADKFAHTYAQSGENCMNSYACPLPYHSSLSYQHPSDSYSASHARPFHERGYYEHNSMRYGGDLCGPGRIAPRGSDQQQRLTDETTSNEADLLLGFFATVQRVASSESGSPKIGSAGSEGSCGGTLSSDEGTMSRTGSFCSGETPAYNNAAIQFVPTNSSKDQTAAAESTTVVATTAITSSSNISHGGGSVAVDVRMPAATSNRTANATATDSEECKDDFNSAPERFHPAHFMSGNGHGDTRVSADSGSEVTSMSGVRISCDDEGTSVGSGSSLSSMGAMDGTPSDQSSDTCSDDSHTTMHATVPVQRKRAGSGLESAPQSLDIIEVSHKKMKLLD